MTERDIPGQTINLPVSRIQSVWLRRLAIAGTYPFLALLNILSVLWSGLVVVTRNAVVFPVVLVLIIGALQVSLFNGAREQWKR